MSMGFTFEGGRVDLSGGGAGHRDGGGGAFRILVIGDFSGRASRGVAESLVGRPVHKVDIDVLDELPKAMGTRVHCDAGVGVEVDVLELDGLHPDELVRGHEVFSALRRVRRRLQDPGTFAEAAAEVQSWSGAAASGASSEIEGKGDVDAGMGDFAALLSGELGQTPSKSDSRARSTVDDMVRQIIGAHIVPTPDPRQADLIASVEEAIAGQLRAILHDAHWQGVEAAWRGLHALCTGLELGEELSLCAMDASIEEIAGSEGELDEVLVKKPRETAGGQPWSLVVLLHRFGPEEAGVLAGLAPIAAASGAPLLAGASEAMLGVASLAHAPEPGAWADATAEGEYAEAWRALREMQEADAIGLALPRVMLRLPYGAKTEPLDALDFEEVVNATGGSRGSRGEAVGHEAYLWGNPAVFVALALGRAFVELQWRLRPAGAADVAGLPVHVLVGGEMQPCAEIWLSDRSADALLGLNLIPMVSYQDQGAVRISAMKSITGRALRASWG